MEGNVYLCDWKKLKGAFEIWCVRTPALKGIGADFGSAETELCDQITRKFGDGEAVLEYVNPPETAGPLAPYAVPELYTITGNGWAMAENKAALYAGGLCPSCQKLVGPRTATPCRISSIESGDGAIVHQGKGLLYSERFLAHFSKEELRGLEFRSVELPPRTRNRYLELLGPAQLPPVAVKRMPGFGGGRCPECGFASFHNMIDAKVVSFVEWEAFLALGRTVTTVDGSLGPMLCLTAAVWSRIKAGTKKMVGARIYAVPRRNIDRNPVVEEWERAKPKSKKSR